MTWEEVRASYPHQWVVIEALEATTVNSQRILHQVRVVEVVEGNGNDALRLYYKHHEIDRFREYYPVHTDREQLDIEVREPLFELPAFEPTRKKV